MTHNSPRSQTPELGRKGKSVSGQDRRIFHRFNHTIDFETEVNGETVTGRTLNTSSGGALLSLPVPPEFGSRLVLNLTPGEEHALVNATIEVVHCGPKADDGFYRIGARWVDLHSAHGADGLDEFLKRILGMVNSRIRHIRNPEEKFVFEFPSFFYQTGGQGGGLADLLEPQLPGEREESRPADRESNDRKRVSRITDIGLKKRDMPEEYDGLWVEMEQMLRGLSARSRSERSRTELRDPEALARLTQASTKKVPALEVNVKVRGRKFKGTICRIGLMSMDVIPETEAPRAYDRIAASLRLPNSLHTLADVTASGTVSRVKTDGTYTIRFTRVEERGNEGLFEAFVLTLLERDK